MKDNEEIKVEGVGVTTDDELRLDEDIFNEVRSEVQVEELSEEDSLLEDQSEEGENEDE
jgi:hypothetical protein